MTADRTSCLTSVAAGRRLKGRLINMDQLGAYLGISRTQARELVVFGHIPSVKMPQPRAVDGRAMRRMLVDLGDVDTFIERHREVNGQANGQAMQPSRASGSDFGTNRAETRQGARD